MNDILHLSQRMKQVWDHIDELSVSTEAGKIKCFISVGYPESRAVVFTGIGNSKENALKQAQDRGMKYIKEKGDNPPWIKIDFVVHEERVSLAEAEELAATVKKFYFNYGISFDAYYNLAFLQQEVNANCFFKYEKGPKRNKRSDKILALAGLSIDTDATKTVANINKNNLLYYVRHYRKLKLGTNWAPADQVILFQTKSYFIEEDKFYEINDTELSNSIRVVKELNAETVTDLIIKSADYLKSTVLEDGKFIYGYFSCFNRPIASYNIVRHALGVYSLAETYQLTGDNKLVDTIKKSLSYMLKNYIYQVDDYAFVVEYSNNEIKLGGLGVCILAISQCLKVLGEFEDREECISIMKKIGNGILYMQNPVTGQFTHVLHYPDLEVAEKFRIVYYSGEAAFALTKLYHLDQGGQWLSALQKAFEYFIQNDYWNHYDHWLAYCTNELTAILPDDKYFSFGLKNAFSNLDFVLGRITTWATFMEMLMAAYQMVEHINKIGKEYLLAGYDTDKLKHAVEVRLRRQLNGIFFPELAMYFKSPETILYGVFIRHHSFRVRNDDVAHHLSGYCHYVTDFLAST